MVDDFEQYIRGGLALNGIEADDTDLAIMRVVIGVYGEELAALRDADLSGHWPESDLDPSRAPSDA